MAVVFPAPLCVVLISNAGGNGSGLVDVGQLR